MLRHADRSVREEGREDVRACVDCEPGRNRHPDRKGGGCVGNRVGRRSCAGRCVVVAHATDDAVARTRGDAGPRPRVPRHRRADRDRARNRLRLYSPRLRIFVGERPVRATLRGGGAHVRRPFAGVARPVRRQGARARPGALVGDSDRAGQHARAGFGRRSGPLRAGDGLSGDAQSIGGRRRARDAGRRQRRRNGARRTRAVAARRKPLSATARCSSKS